MDVTGPQGYAWAANYGEWVKFPGSEYDLAYGADGKYFYRYGLNGDIGCNNGEFGDPAPGAMKACYIRKASSPVAGISGGISGWIQKNPLQAAIIGIGAFFLLRGRRRLF